MSQTPFEHAGGLRIGAVDFVSPDEIKVALDIEAPESVALNTGEPRSFPRVNSYVLIPVDDAYLVGQVQWLTVERSPFPKRRGMQDFGLVDLPYPLRKMSVNPLGILRKAVDFPSDKGKYIFRRGAEALPSIGSGVLLPTEAQLHSIIESGEKRYIMIGRSPMAGDAEVRVDPDRLFGRHLAVLGNTGSGKSCSVAGLIRWSLEQARSARNGSPNARFIVLDPNGEYSRAFSSKEPGLKVRLFKVNAGDDESFLRVPLWFWSAEEWSSFVEASSKTQRPTLTQALRAVRDGLSEPVDSVSHELRRFLRTLLTTIRIAKNDGTPWGQFPKSKSFYEKLEKWKEGLEPYLHTLEGEESRSLTELVHKMEELCAPRRVQYAHHDFGFHEINQLIDLVSSAYACFGGSLSDVPPVNADTPIEFSGESLIRSVEATAEMLNVSEYVETLLIRMRGLLADSRINSVLCDTDGMTLSEWLKDYLGDSSDDEASIVICDLSLVPVEVVHIITAVIARMVFEALQRYRRLNKQTLPTVMVMEEAHTFIKRYKDDAENASAASVCCQVFERIAREGRKFGLGLVLSSQRPSELSQTVLSQCNTFILHRISNDRDQELVQRLVPDNLKGLLRELPTLPSQSAILLGWASELPVLVKMNELPKSQQPRSDDPDFWNVWVGKDSIGSVVERKTDWESIAAEWQGKTPGTDEAMGTREADTEMEKVES